MFLISDHDEKGLIRKLKWTSAGLVFGGGALAVAAFGYVIYSIGLLGW